MYAQFRKINVFDFSLFSVYSFYILQVPCIGVLSLYIFDIKETFYKV